MAQISISGGRIGPTPVTAGRINLNDADMNAIVGTVAGMTKAAVGVSAVGLGIVALGSLLASGSSKTCYGPITPIASVETYDQWPCLYGGVLKPSQPSRRSFLGVCLTKELSLVTDEGHLLRIPVEMIVYYRPFNSYKHRHGFLWTKSEKRVSLYIELLDGSKYTGYIINPTEFEFVTLLGKQTVDIFTPHAIGACKFKDANKLREVVALLIEKEGAAINTALGEARFRQFFSQE
ncbi:MAG: hypothetical protein V5B36_07015 [Candidatus Accumulibacter sp. UW25]|jgi:hypothetical protein